jgi:hypothetical protein
MPTSATQWLLRMNLIIHPGLETSDYIAAIDQYTRALDEINYPLKDKRCMVFGYGGRFAVGCGLLEGGASHVVLCDKFGSIFKIRWGTRASEPRIHHLASR